MGFSETLEMARGESPTMTVTAKDQNGTVFPLTGFTATLYVREDGGDATDYVFSVAGVIALPLTGVITFTIPKATTAAWKTNQCKVYIFDVRIVDATRDFSIARGTLEVLATAKKKT